MNDLHPSDVRVENAPSDLLDRAISRWLPIRTDLDRLREVKRSFARGSQERSVARKALRRARARYKDVLRGERDVARKAYEGASARERPERRRDLIVANLTLQLFKRHVCGGCTKGAPRSDNASSYLSGLS